VTAASIDPRLDSRRSWVMAGAATTSMFAVFGVAYSFGAFFTSMSEEFGSGSGATALVFSITISLSFVFGMFTGRWADRVGPRPVLIAGAASLTGGLLLTATVQNIWLGYLTYGIGVGFAIACGYVPMVAAVSGWFHHRRATAIGVAVSGIGLGTLIGSPVAARLIEATSWRTTYVIFALVGGALLLAVAAVAERGPAAVASDKPRPLLELLRVTDFTILYVSLVLASMSLFVPFVFLGSFAESEGISEVSAAALIGIIGGASVIGRLGLGGLADRAGVTRLFRLSFAGMAVSHVLWLSSGGRFAILVLYAVVFGIGYGGFIALSPAVAALRFGLDGLGGLLGTLYTAAAIGSLTGPPIAGVLIDQWGHGAAIGFALFLGLASLAVLSRFNESPTRF